MFEQFLFFLVLGTLVFLGVVSILMFVAYRHRLSRRSAPPTLWGAGGDDFVRSHGTPANARRRLIATIGYADRSKLVTRN